MNEKIALLNDLGDPREIDGNHGSEWPDYLQYGFTEADVPELLAIIMDIALYEDPAREGNCVWIHLHAWRTLGQLRSVEAINPFISVFNYYMEVDDEWALAEFSEVMGMIGESAIEPLLVHLSDASNHEYARVLASDSLGKIVKHHPESRDKVVATYKTYISAPDCSAKSVNGLLTCQLIDIKAIELIDDIRQLFQNNCVEISVPGDLEDVEIALGLRKERETPKPHYGIFSEEKTNEIKSMLDNFTKSHRDPEIKTIVHQTNKVGRNAPCPCGSGKKYKKCCLH